MTGIDADDSSEGAWVEMIDKRGFAFGVEIRADFVTLLEKEEAVAV